MLTGRAGGRGERWERQGEGNRLRVRLFETGEGLLLPSPGLDPADTPSIPIMAFPLPLIRDMVRAHLPV